LRVRLKCLRETLGSCHRNSCIILVTIQLFYLMSRGMTESEAATMIVSGFIEPLTKILPMEYSIELNKLIELQMEGSVG